MRIAELFKFIVERERVRQRKEAGLPKPWSKDPIFQNYRFCNVYRELDTVTQWITTNWRHKHPEDRHVWFAMAVARYVNWPESLAEIGYPVPWNPAHFVKVLKDRASRGEKVFSAAYVTMTPLSSKGQPKEEYLAEHILTPLWEMRENYAPWEGQTLEEFHTRLMTHHGVGSFMAAQIVADVKYTRPLSGAEDWRSFTAQGMGSERGLNRLCVLPLKKKWGAKAFKYTMAELQLDIDARMVREDLGLVHRQDLQNCLCEFDKYERIRLNEGRVRSKYKGAKDD
jgi:alpha-glutamyl/putrescinyl thymine pyrophosphorylase clade 1